MTAHTNLKRADEKYPQSHTQPAVGSLRWTDLCVDDLLFRVYHRLHVRMILLQLLLHRH